MAEHFAFQTRVGPSRSPKSFYGDVSSGEKDLFLVDDDASAASGRSAGTKKKRKVKHGKEPGEKKARGEVTQPDLPPEELKRICLSNNRLEKWAVFDASFSDPPQCVAEIVSVIEMKNEYKFGSKRTNLVLNLRHAGEEQIVTLRGYSNQSINGALQEVTEMPTWWKGSSLLPVLILQGLGDLLAPNGKGRSSRTKGLGRRKLVERKPSGPEEKKARVEVIQPALPPEELRRICLSNNMLEKWCNMPSFATTVTGFFVREDFDDSFGDRPHCVSEIVSVTEMRHYYEFGSKLTNLVLNLRHAGEDKTESLWAVSNQEFTESEFKQWEAEMIAAGMKVPTPEMIATKEKSIKEALDPTFTQGELDFIVDKTNRFRAAPLNVAKRKITLLEYQSAARSRGDADMVERKFLIAITASAASWRSAGTKRKRQVEQEKGPEEKKACVEVNQPALPPE
ncbi:unnamed protein product [Pleuronectes platessa]|uniref:Plus3 domain-containing protein n=1 Tax=Pleuronectes platessa TaxID=8262 RepID=A0A9N7W2D5_PLEPL|nr:unnamed protein product [Pleuronectes platessa]